MAFDGILTSGLSAILTNTAALRVTAENIANANTPGYARRVVQQSPLAAGGQVSGVQIAQIQRITNAYLDQEVMRANSTSSQYGAQSLIMDRLDSALGQPGDGQSIGSTLDAVYAALGQAALDPSTLASRLGALGQIDAFARSISELSGSVADLRASADQEMGAVVSQANILIKKIYDINPEIHRAMLAGDTATGFLDERDRLVQELSKLFGIRTSTQADGRLYVSTTDGVQLVGDNYAQLVHSPRSGPSFDPIMIQTISSQTGQPVGVPQPFDPHINSGELGGLLQIRDGSLVAIGEELGALAQSASLAFNAAHNANAAMPPPAVLSGRETGLLSSDALNFTGATTIGVVDVNGALLHKLVIDFDAGTVSVDGGGASPIGGTIGSFSAALNGALGAEGTADFTDGVLTMSATGGNGLVIADEPGNATSRGGLAFSQFFGLNDLFESSGNAIVTTGLTVADAHGFAPGGAISLLLKGPQGQRVGETSVAVTGTTIGDMITALNTAFTGKASFALDGNGELTVTPGPGYFGYELDVTLDSTARGSTGESFSSLFGMGVGEKLARARSFSLATALEDSPQRLAFAQPALTSATALSTSIMGPGDNRGLLALQDLINQAHAFTAAGSLTGRSVTFSDYAASFYQDVASRGTAIETSKQTEDARLRIAEQNQSKQEGVNLDEELAMMMVLQQAYNAGARLIQVSQQISDELMKVVG